MNYWYRLQSIFRDVFDDPTLKISPDLAVGTYPDWDSVATLQIVLAVEAEFGVRFSTDDVAAIRSVANLAHLLATRHGIERAVGGPALQP